MKKLFLAILIIFLLTGCNNSENKKDAANRMELIPEPDKALREKYEEQQK